MSFLSLPLEIREEIYRVRFSRGFSVKGKTRARSDWAATQLLSPLGVSRQIRDEVTNVIARDVEIRVPNLAALRIFCEDSEQRGSNWPSKLRRITITFDLGEWFYLTTVPSLVNSPWTVQAVAYAEAARQDTEDPYNVRNCIQYIGRLSPTFFTLRINDNLLFPGYARGVSNAIFKTVSADIGKFGINCDEERTYVALHHCGETTVFSYPVSTIRAQGASLKINTSVGWVYS